MIVQFFSKQASKQAIGISNMEIRSTLCILGTKDNLTKFVDEAVAERSQIWTPNMENVGGILYLTFLYTGDDLPYVRAYIPINNIGNKLEVANIVSVQAKSMKMTNGLYNHLLQSLYSECLSKYEKKFGLKIVLGES